VKRAAGSAALGAVLLLCAATFAMRSLYIPGITFVALGVGFGVWVTVAAAGAGLKREPGPATVEEDAPWPMRIVVTPGLIPPPGGEVLEPFAGRPIGFKEFGRTRTRARAVRVEVRFSRRGRQALGPAQLVIRDPLGLATRELEGDAQGAEVLVLPRLEPVVPVEGGGAPGRLLRGREGADEGGAGQAPAPEMELDVLRPYRPGSPATRIHWPTLARTGELMERRFVADPSARPLIVVDSHDPVGPRELDAAMRAAASLANHVARAGGCAVILPGDRQPTTIGQDLRAFPEIHARLALLEPSAAVPLIARRSSSAPVVWVTASRLIPSLPLRMGGGWIVAPHALAPGAPVEFRVGGCIGQRLAAVWKEAA
jgi:uncharacterized protein (DUF58 family)